MLLIIRERATPKQISQMSEVYNGLMIKLAVDVQHLINIRPRQQNRGLEITNPLLREKIESIVRRLLDIN